MVIRLSGSAWLILRQSDDALLSAELAYAVPLPSFDE